MSSHASYRGARHRTLILMYIAWLTLSLAPAMIAPSERTFQQGQPEMQQSMDNMVNRQTIIQKRSGNSVEDKDQVLETMNKFKEVNSKTSSLLGEAEKVLKALPDTKERQWVESFVTKMQEIAKMLETAAESNQMAKDLDLKKSVPVPDKLPKQPAAQPKQPATSVDPKTDPIQKPMSKIQMTSPEINRVLPEDDQSEHQAVTKPVVTNNEVEDAESDELVKELESLQKENIHETVSENSKADDKAQTTTIPSTPLPSRPQVPQSVIEQVMKAKQEEANLINEIKEFHRKGGVLPKEIVDTMYADSHKTDSTEKRKVDIDEAMKFTDMGMKDRRGVTRLDDLSNEERAISMANMKPAMGNTNMPPDAAQQFQYMKFNNTLPNNYPNMMPGFPKQPGYYYPNVPSYYRAQPYPGRPQNMDPNFPRMNPYNQGRYFHMLHQGGPNPDARFSKPAVYYNGRLPPYVNHNHFIRPGYNPYPYMHNWNPQNSTIHFPQMMPPFPNNQPKIETQLSDEMKRELRDGKIVMLSDSVVRTNFDQANDGKNNPNTTGKVSLQKVDMKNETVTEN